MEITKRIILLSDGTGNAASSIWRTNVWRVFESIDLAGSDQVAFYDDGVGTSSFKPLALLGGAFGWGLKRNIIDLYKFLCRNYRPGAEIFAFGFSRGAFTIRMIVGLISNQGLIPYCSEADLDAKAIAAYRAFRRENFHSLHGGEIWLRRLRDAWIKLLDRLNGRESYDKKKNIDVTSIRFLGLWDTVAAYGFPIEEMTRGISQWIWPLEFPDRILSDTVKRACHALALDDERTTFHPLLWTEKNEPSAGPIVNSGRTIKDERISQVWFSGMHSNVGGGYPDDSLAFIPLYWIMKEAQSCGLRLKTGPEADPDAVRHAKSARDKDGRLYDSRRGLGGYYRYGPRDIHGLCHARLSHKPDDTVEINISKIHESALLRISNGATPYAPIGFPARYEVVTEDGRILNIGNNQFETEAQANGRAIAQERVWNLVWWRRVVYFLTVIASFHLLVFPLVHQTVPAAEFSTQFTTVSEMVRIVGAFLPHFITVWWLDAYATNPRSTLLGILAVAGFISLGGFLGQQINDEMRCIWKAVPSSESRLAKLLNDGIYRLRTSQPYRSFMRIMKRYILPACCALITIYVVLTLTNHAVFNLADAAGNVCVESSSTTAVSRTPASGVPKVFEAKSQFDTRSLCWASGLTLQEGQRYVMRIKQDKSQLWSNRGYTTDLGGLEMTQLPNWYSRAFMFITVPMRRVLLRPYFRIIARIGSVGADEYFLDPDYPRAPHVDRLDIPIKPHRNGELFLYVNDSVIGIPGLANSFYRYNSGLAAVTVEQRDR